MHALPAFKPPFYGAAYYPEDWPDAEVARDIALMKQAGMNVMRIGEFAWSRMEPREGEFDFRWLHRVIGKLADAGIATVLGTPTATPPAWLTTKHPEVLFVTPTGLVIGHGGRRHICPASPVYRDYCRKIVTRMAEEFGRDPRVVGWQIDNEAFNHNDSVHGRVWFSRACCTPASLAAFRAWLEERFGDIQALNRAWCLALWSQEYDSFRQVPAPDPNVWHHPSLLQAWDEFNNECWASFIRLQGDILREKATQPVGTDMMPFPDLDHADLHETLDVVQFNHYDFNDRLWHAAFWFDAMRPIKGASQPFWCTETATTYAGALCTTGTQPPGFCRANSWLAFALGGEANLYWLWRTHWAGQELMHGSVLQTSGRPMHVFGEVQEIAAGLAASAEFLNSTHPEPTGLALHKTHRAWSILRNQPLAAGFDFLGVLQEHWYRPLLAAHLRVDLVGARAGLDAYKVVMSPCLPDLSEGRLRERLLAWIESGGIWVAGPATDIRDREGAKFHHAPHSVLEQWAGAFMKYEQPAHPEEFGVRLADGGETNAKYWTHGYEPRGCDAVLATYTSGPSVGLAAAVEKRVGLGRIVLLGATLEPAATLRLVRRLCAEVGVHPAAQASSSLVVAPRSGGGMQGVVCVEIENRPAEVVLPRAGTDLITGRRVEGPVAVAPFGVLVVRYD